MKNLFAILSSTLIVLLSFQNATVNDAVSENLTESSEITFTLSGDVYNDHPELSWNSVPNATYYKLHRLPVPALGGIHKVRVFNTTGNSIVDVQVHGAQLGPGLKQVRYKVEAYNFLDVLIDSDGPVDFTANYID